MVRVFGAPLRVGDGVQCNLRAQLDEKNTFAGFTREIVPFLACGDLSSYDPDRAVPLEVRLPFIWVRQANLFFQLQHRAPYVLRGPTQGPINPPYQTALDLRRTNRLD